MTIVLTGASGMVGSAVFAELTQAGRKVRLLTYKGTGSGGSVESRQMPPAGADLSEFREALRGAGSVVHCAALNNDEGASSDALFEANAVLAGKLAQAAADVVPGRFVHLSSIRAVAGAESSGTVSEATPPAPTCAYGASKLAGEKAVREAFRDQPGRFVILRPAPIYGVGMRGGLRTLLRLADSPWPLPFASLAAPRSLLSLERAVGAILLALARERLTRADYVVSDADAVSIAGILAAFRAGLSRPPRLFPVPPFLFAQAARLTGRQAAWLRIVGGQVCDPSALAALGWTAETDSRAALAALARQMATPN